jgi:hypothetical protein
MDRDSCFAAFSTVGTLLGAAAFRVYLRLGVSLFGSSVFNRGIVVVSSVDGVCGMAQPKSELIHVWVTDRFRHSLKNAAVEADVSVGEYIRRSITQSMLRGGEYKYRELVFSPNGNSTIDQLMEWLCARNPIYRDITGCGGTLDSSVRGALYKTLPEIQARRIERFLNGDRLESIGLDEGCSRQAVHASIQRGIAKLSDNRIFINALLEVVPDSGLTVETVMEAFHG